MTNEVAVMAGIVTVELTAVTGEMATIVTALESVEIARWSVPVDVICCVVRGGIEIGTARDGRAVFVEMTG